MISLYRLPLCPYLSFSNGSAAVGTGCYYVTAGHHGNIYPHPAPTPLPTPHRWIQSEWLLKTTHHTRSFMGWYSKQQMAQSKVFHAWNKEQRAQTHRASCEIVLFCCIYLENKKSFMWNDIWITFEQILIRRCIITIISIVLNGSNTVRRSQIHYSTSGCSVSRMRKQHNAVW